MTETEIIYSILEIVRNSEVTIDEKMTEDFLRHLIYTYRADAIEKTVDISEELFQPYYLQFEKTKNFYEAELPDILYMNQRMGISFSNWGLEVPITSKEEALISQKSKFHKAEVIGFVQHKKLKLIINQSSTTQNLINQISYQDKTIEISCILAEPNVALNYDPDVDIFPLDKARLATMRYNLLRREFGVMVEMKKDEIQNARADNIIYQDESKLYK